MARVSLSLNEGSLFKRTAVHVVAAVLGTAAFLAFMSFLLVTIVQSVLPGGEETKSSATDSAEEEPASSSKPSSVKPPRSPRKKRGPSLAAPKPEPAEE